MTQISLIAPESSTCMRALQTVDKYVGLITFVHCRKEGKESSTRQADNETVQY